MQGDSVEIDATEDRSDQGFCSWSDAQMNNKKTKLQWMMTAVLKKKFNISRFWKRTSLRINEKGRLMLTTEFSNCSSGLDGPCIWAGMTILLQIPHIKHYEENY